MTWLVQVPVACLLKSSCTQWKESQFTGYIPEVLQDTKVCPSLDIVVKLNLLLLHNWSGRISLKNNRVVWLVSKGSWDTRDQRIQRLCVLCLGKGHYISWWQFLGFFIRGKCRPIESYPVFKYRFQGRFSEPHHHSPWGRSETGKPTPLRCGYSNGWPQSKLSQLYTAPPATQTDTQKQIQRHNPGSLPYKLN